MKEPPILLCVCEQPLRYENPYNPKYSTMAWEWYSCTCGKEFHCVARYSFPTLEGYLAHRDMLHRTWLAIYALPQPEVRRSYEWFNKHTWGVGRYGTQIADKPTYLKMMGFM